MAERDPGEGMTELRSLLDRVVRGLGPHTDILAVHNHWITVVGEQVAAHCVPRRIVDGRLTVEVDQPGWATELKYLESTVLERLAEHVGEGRVTGIVVTVGRR